MEDEVFAALEEERVAEVDDVVMVEAAAEGKEERIMARPASLAVSSLAASLCSLSIPGELIVFKYLE